LEVAGLIINQLEILKDFYNNPYHFSISLLMESKSFQLENESRLNYECN
jgi:hypothetical protein